MYAKIRDNQIVQYPYGYAELQADNPYTNFNGAALFQAFQGTETNLAGNTLELVITQDTPQYDANTQNAVLATVPVLENAQWVLKWAVTDKTAEELAQPTATQAAQVRAERNQKLAVSDWTQLADAPVDKAAWAAYRQALRDITTQAGFPWAVDWPVAP